MIEKTNASLELRRVSRDGSVMLVTMAVLTILMVMVATTLISTTNKYFTAYQWASWQEALQGAESGADIAMAEMRKDVAISQQGFIGWQLGNYQVVGGNKTLKKDPSTYKNIDSSGFFIDNSGGGGGNKTNFNLRDWINGKFNNNFDFVTYTTQLTPHAGEGNNNLRITVTIDKPASLKDTSGRQWLRVRATGSTDLAGPSRVSEEKLDNRLRKLGLLFDKVFAERTTATGSYANQATRQIELVAKPVTLFAGAMTAMVQIKSDGQGIWSDSFNSEGYYDTIQKKIVPWPINNNSASPNFGTFDFTMSHDPTLAIGKNGDIASNAFPIKHDHSQNLDLTNDIIYGDVGNNYSQIKNLDPAYYTNAYDATANPFGLDNGSYGNTNPNPKLIDAKGHADVSGAIETNFYRDLPPVQDPNVTDPTWAPTVSISTKDKSGNQVVIGSTGDIASNQISTDPTNPTKIKVSSITLAKTDKWTIHAPPVPSGWNATSKPAPAVGHVQIWVTGNGDALKLDDGGTVIIESVTDGASGLPKAYTQVEIFVDHNIKIGETKETKTNSGGFDVQSDDAKDLLIYGVTQTDANKLPKDDYVDPLGNDAIYTPYKASGNIVFTETDFTGAIYAPDHNIIFSNTQDGRGKRHKRGNNGADFYGSYVGRTINNKKGINVHFDESLNDSGPQLDWGYVSWFEDVDVDNR